MPLREEFDRTGQWLFRWRSYLPLLLFLPVLAALHDFTYFGGSHALDLAWEAVCIGVAFTGLLVRAATVGFAARGTSGRNTSEGQVAATVNTTGLYSLVRHPLYLGNYLMWLGPALFPRRWWLPLLVSLIFCVYYERIMFAEEEFLRRKFGALYEEWASATPAFLPFTRGWRQRWRRPALPFSLATVLQREYSGFYGAVATFTVLETVADRAAMGRWTWDPAWVAFFAGGTLVYVALLLAKRRTRTRRARAVRAHGG